jgi:dipeptidyl aminopeptidase/acylaminoacyl peptidase
VALAPNAFTLLHRHTTFPMPAALAERGAVRHETRVGPPDATLVSWLMTPRGPVKGTIVLLHGVRMDRRSLVDTGVRLTDAGYRTLLVDLRGHGESTGRYLTYGAVEAHDLSALLDSVAAGGVDLGCVGVYGFSYGGAVALEFGARDERVQAVVAVAPFSSLREVVSDYSRKYLPAPLSAIPRGWFDGAVDRASWLASFDPDSSAPLRAVSHSQKHQLLIHGTADNQVPMRHSLALMDVAGPLTRIVPIQGASHENMPADVVREEALGWFDRWLLPAPCPRVAQSPGETVRTEGTARPLEHAFALQADGVVVAATP